MNDKVKKQILGIVFFIVVIGISTYFYFNISIDDVTNKIIKNNDINILFIIFDEDKIVLSEAVIFNTSTNRLGIVDIPVGAGNIISSLERSDRYSVLYKHDDSAGYESIIGDLLGLDFLTTINISLTNLEKLVDLLSGINVFIPNEIDLEIDDKRYLLPTGNTILDGDKTGVYLSLPVSAEHKYNANQKNQRFLNSFFISMSKLVENNDKSAYFSKISALMSTDLNSRSLRRFFDYLGTVQNENNTSVVYQDFFGKERVVQDKTIIFPQYNDGEFLQNRINWIKKSLEKALDSSNQKLKIEILNGTKRNGLASKTASIYESYNFNVVKVDNAEQQDYEQTVVIDLIGSIKNAQEVADVIHGKKIETDLSSIDSGAAVRIILGEDFYAPYVK